MKIIYSEKKSLQYSCAFVINFRTDSCFVVRKNKYNDNWNGYYIKDVKNHPSENFSDNFTSFDEPLANEVFFYITEQTFVFLIKIIERASKKTTLLKNTLRIIYDNLENEVNF